MTQSKLQIQFNEEWLYPLKLLKETSLNFLESCFNSDDNGVCASRNFPDGFKDESDTWCTASATYLLLKFKPESQYIKGGIEYLINCIKKDRLSRTITEDDLIITKAVCYSILSFVEYLKQFDTDLTLEVEKKFNVLLDWISKTKIEELDSCSWGYGEKITSGKRRGYMKAESNIISTSAVILVLCKAFNISDHVADQNNLKTNIKHGLKYLIENHIIDDKEKIGYWKIFPHRELHIEENYEIGATAYAVLSLIESLELKKPILDKIQIGKIHEIIKNSINFLRKNIKEEGGWDEIGNLFQGFTFNNETDARMSYFISPHVLKAIAKSIKLKIISVNEEEWKGIQKLTLLYFLKNIESYDDHSHYIKFSNVNVWPTRDLILGIDEIDDEWDLNYLREIFLRFKPMKRVKKSNIWKKLSIIFLNLFISSTITSILVLFRVDFITIITTVIPTLIPAIILSLIKIPEEKDED